MSTTSEVKKDCLWIVLFLIVFINGFEAGGYQASLWSVGKNYDLSVTSMGLFAAMELFATMLAPILLGRWADSVEKARSISLMLAIQFIAAATILFTSADRLFLVCIFFRIPATMLLLSAASDPFVVLLLCVPLGFASGAIYPSVLTIMLPYAGKNTATATGIITAATGIGGVVFTAMTGFLADRFGLQTAMLVLVSFFIVSLLSAIRVFRLSRT